MPTRALLPLVAVIGLAIGAQSAMAQTGPSEYAVKFVCGRRAPAAGTDPREAVLPGVYSTAINIRNADRDTAHIRVQIATTQFAPLGGKIIPLPDSLLLLRGQALEFDCVQILEAAARDSRHAIPFMKGFAVLLSNRMLDVVAVYTAGPTPNVATMEVVRVAPSRASQ